MFQRQQRNAARGICRRKALRAWEAAALVRCSWKGTLVSPAEVGLIPSSRGRRDRKRQWPVQPACATTEEVERRSEFRIYPMRGGPHGQGWGMVTARDRGTDRGMTRGRRCPRGYSAPRRRVLLQSACERARGRAGLDVEVVHGASRQLGSFGFQSGARDNKLVAETGERCLSRVGRRRFGAAGTVGDSRARRPTP